MTEKKLKIIFKWINRIIASLGLISIGIILTILLFSNLAGDNTNLIPVFSLLLGSVIGGLSYTGGKSHKDDKEENKKE